MAVPYLFRYWLPAFSALMLVLMVAFGWPAGRLAGVCFAYLLGWLVWLIGRRLSRRPDRPDLATRLANDLRGSAQD